MMNIDKEKNDKILEETKTKIIWELQNRDDIDCILFADGRIHGGCGETKKTLNALSNVIMDLTRVGIPKKFLKEAVKRGLNWERYIVNE